MKFPLIVSVLALAVVLVVGVGITEFPAYLGDDPTTCNNCHVMDGVYEGWFHGKHARWAACSDCHVPHDSFIEKYVYKGMAGMNHVFHFTLNTIPEPIRAKENTKEIVQKNCLHCHGETVAEVADGQMGAGRYCFDCHRTVAHGERGISILPYQDRGAIGIVYPKLENEK